MIPKPEGAMIIAHESIPLYRITVGPPRGGLRSGPLWESPKRIFNIVTSQSLQQLSNSKASINDQSPRMTCSRFAGGKKLEQGRCASEVEDV